MEFLKISNLHLFQLKPLKKKIYHHSKNVLWYSIKNWSCNFHFNNPEITTHDYFPIINIIWYLCYIHNSKCNSIFYVKDTFQLWVGGGILFSWDGLIKWSQNCLFCLVLIFLSKYNTPIYQVIIPPSLFISNFTHSSKSF